MATVIVVAVIEAALMIVHFSRQRALRAIKEADARARGVFHRVRCACPACGADVPAGRLAQHAAVHGVHMR